MMNRSLPIACNMILLILVLTLPLVAQAQTAPAENSTLTAQEREAAIKYLEETRQKFLDSVKDLSETQWKFKAAPDRWSAAEVAEHIAISEEMLLKLASQQIMKSPAAPEKKEAAKGKEELLRKSLTNRSVKVQAPEMLKPTNRWASRDELVKAFNANRDQTIEYVKTTQDDLRSHFGPHPIFKDLDAYQWLILLAGHSERHTLQILEVKADTNFPKK
jgi:DinB family protein